MFIRRAKLEAQAMNIRANTDYYTELKWLQTSGGQMINTHLRGNQDMKIYMEAHSYMNQQYRVPIFSDCDENGDSQIYMCRATNVERNYFGNASVDVAVMFGHENVIMNKDIISVNGYGYRFYDAGEFTTSDIYLFTNPEFGFGNYYSRIYYVTLIIDDVTHEIIPILDEDGVPCMYNKTTREFYYNEGEGEFVYELKDS